MSSISSLPLTIEDMPNESLRHIFSFLSNPEPPNSFSSHIQNVRLVNKHWNEVALIDLEDLKKVKQEVEKLKSSHTKSHTEIFFGRICLAAGKYLDDRWSKRQTITLRFPIVLGLYLVRPFIRLAQIIENIIKLIWIRITNMPLEIRKEMSQICLRRLIKAINLLVIECFIGLGISWLLFYRDTKLPDDRIESHHFRTRLVDISGIAQDSHQFTFFAYQNVRNNKDSVLFNFFHYLLDVSQEPVLKEAYHQYLDFLTFPDFNEGSSSLDSGRWTILYNTQEEPSWWRPIHGFWQTSSQNPQTEKINNMSIYTRLNSQSVSLELSSSQKDLVQYLLT